MLEVVAQESIARLPDRQVSQHHIRCIRYVGGLGHAEGRPPWSALMLVAVEPIECIARQCGCGGRVHTKVLLRPCPKQPGHRTRGRGGWFGRLLGLWQGGRGASISAGCERGRDSQSVCLNEAKCEWCNCTEITRRTRAKQHCNQAYILVCQTQRYSKVTEEHKR
jgi:hypothetical protein